MTNCVGLYQSPNENIMIIHNQKYEANEGVGSLIDSFFIFIRKTRLF